MCVFASCVLGMLGPASSSGRTDEDQPSGQVKDGDKVTSSSDTLTSQHITTQTKQPIASTHKIHTLISYTLYELHSGSGDSTQTHKKVR